MKDQDNEPPFILGLRKARAILVDLKNKKNQQLSVEKTPQKPQSSKYSPIKSQIQQSPSEPIMSKVPLFKQEKVLLQDKVNKLAEELFECYQENQQYELVFRRLAEYYCKNRNIIDQNQKLNRVQKELTKEMINYQNKIKQNQEKTELIDKNTQTMKIMVKQGLQTFLNSQYQKGQQKPLKSLSFQHINLQLKEQKLQKEQEKQQNLKINLNFHNFKSQVSRKAVIRKNQGSQQKDISRSLYSSQLYSL